MSLLLFLEAVLASNGLIWLLGCTNESLEGGAGKYLHKHLFIGLLSWRLASEQ